MLEPITQGFRPSKIVCVGRNYVDHAKELGNEVPKAPLLFLKAPSAFVVSGEPIVIPRQSQQVEHEAELAIIISKQCRNLRDDDAVEPFIKGFTCLNDVTARDVQRGDVQFTRGKSFDTFCPIGPHIVGGLDTSDLSVICRVNGEVRQQGRTSQMVFPHAYLIRYISRQMTLMPGDVIATGTPAGVSKLNEGDVCEVEIEGIGVLSNPVTAAKD
ncbi:MAG: fumarylacetoacetate hydrolase family protein [Acidobacteria bacterium OLB17]|nr:MAG: fumarylacetoacetate hydrolase family protein [Acidobacteria bacterium OLB17]MCZ2389575.1 fumarylacetoacetate hydrolase family protein [Acidobacteriota bacterium]